VKQLVIGTRGSRLALSQCKIVKRLLRQVYDGRIIVKIIKTRGDISKRLSGKGDFVREIDRAVLRGDVDIAVHSLKDMPSSIERGLVLACVPKRETPYDALVSKKYRSIAGLKPGSIVGTGSIRRNSQLFDMRKDIKIEELRGNVDTRLSLLRRFDAIILAEAGLKRLGYRKYSRIPVNEMVPCAGQGSLGIVCRTGDGILGALKKIEHPKSRREAEEERSCVMSLGADCKTPLGVLAREKHGKIKMYGTLWTGGKLVRKVVTGKRGVGRKLAKILR